MPSGILPCSPLLSLAYQIDLSRGNIFDGVLPCSLLLGAHLVHISIIIEQYDRFGIILIDFFLSPKTCYNLKVTNANLYQ